MSLPPLTRTKYLSRLLGPEEVILYTGRLHPFHGFGWLAAAVAFLMLARWWLWFVVPALGFLIVYQLPFNNTEIVVTSYRLLLRRGRCRVHLDAIDAHHLDHYQLHQTPFSVFFHYGTVILNLDTVQDIRALTLKTIWHPMTFLEALTTLNPAFRQEQK